MSKRANLNTWLLMSLFLLVMAGTAVGQIITVDDDGPADFNNIQAAINDSDNGDIIEVQPGIYTGDGNRDIYFGRKAITLRSTDPNDPNVVANTIINCNGTEAEPHNGFYFSHNEDAKPVLDGLTIINGYTDYGGGVYIYGSSPTIKNCIFEKNTAHYHGGGIYNCFGSPTVIECVFSANMADVDYSSSRGGGMYNRYDSNPTLINCIFNDNSASSGAGMFNQQNSSPTLTNCTFTSNSAVFYGGGMFSIADGHLTLTNCTFFGNSAQTAAGAMYNVGRISSSLTNCIFWGNTSYYGHQILIDQYSTLSISYCDIQDGPSGGIAVYNYSLVDWGDGNINAHPLLASNGYHLLSGSPCINAGDPAGDYSGQTDIDGQPRVIGGRVDIGADELVPMLEVPMKFTPQALNPGSKGNWVKAHFVLPDGFAVEDVDVNTPATIVPLGIESEYIDVFVNEDGLVEIEAAFGHADFCGAVGDYRPAEVTVIGRLVSGQYFYGTDTIRIITNNLKYLAVFASYWLDADCGPPDWCGGVDLDQDSVVDFVDFALFDGCCIEVVKE